MSWKDLTTGERVALIMLAMALAWSGWVAWLDANAEPGTALEGAYIAMVLVAGAVGMFIGLIVAISMVFIGGGSDHGKFRRFADRFLPLATFIAIMIALQIYA